MKNLKKWTALAAAMAMTATLLTGCGSSEAPASEAAASTTESAAAESTAAETPAADGELAADVQAIVDRGVLRVGVKNAVVGFGFQDTLTGEYSGLEISIGIPPCFTCFFHTTNRRRMQAEAVFMKS